MHAGAQPGINVDVAADLEANFAWALPLAPQTQNIDDDPLDEIDAAFGLLERDREAMEQELVDGNEVFKLEHVDQGLAPKSVTTRS
ncbi:hypothetical protein EV702DRAFT_1196394 [Suillus placidus]|uniref:Uncharacterized protein n=1 Tax=Suillus placidus TaxID=48579 RepID=A0A9P6ZX64_9AGAM|nr:hypothetical protein EV702DRAFT_1196394 [Suillus placidus]